MVGLWSPAPWYENENVVLLEALLVPDKVVRICLTKCGSGTVASSWSVWKENRGRDGIRLVAGEAIALLRPDLKVGAGDGGRGEKTEVLGEGGAGGSESGAKTPRGLAGLAQERLADILGLSLIRHSGGGCTFGEEIILTDVLDKRVNGKLLE